MRIVQLIDSLHWGGAQKLQVTFAEAVQNRDLDLIVISLNQHREGVPLPNDLEALGAKVIVMAAPHLYNLKRVWRLARFLRQEQVDLVHTHLTYANIIGPVAAKLAGVPVVASIHNEKYHPQRDNTLRRRLETLMLRFGADKLIAVGQAVVQAQRERFSWGQLDVIQNAVSPVPPISESHRREIREGLIGDPSRPLLLSVGRLSPQKGYRDLLAAVPRVLEKHPEAAFVIAGGGGSRADLSREIAELNLEGSVFLLGYRNDVPDLLAASDLFVNSSHWEGLPVAVLEAMSAGLPIVATRVGDVPQVLGEHAGVLVPPKQPAALATALIALLDDPERMKATGEAAKQRVLHHYSPGAWAENLLEVYAEVIRSSHG